MISAHVVFATTQKNGETYASMWKVLAKSPRGAAQRVRTVIRPSGAEIVSKPRAWPLDHIDLTPNASWPAEEAADD